MEQQKNSGKTWHVMLWGVVVLLLGAGALATLQLRGSSAHAPGQVPMAPIAADAVRKDVIALAQLDPEELAELLAPTPAVRQFAERACAGQTTRSGRAQALVAALSARRGARAYADWSRVEPRIEPPLTAQATLRALQHDAAERRLYPLELAALGVAALRSLDVPAMLAEVYAYPNERRPVDPSGRFGYFGIFVPEGSLPGSGALSGRVYDAYAGRSQAPNAGDFSALNDAQAVGAALAVRAMHALRIALDLDRAERDSAAALALLPGSASAHAVRAAVMLTVGHPAAKDGKAGRQELEAARELRDGAAQRTNLALNDLTHQDAVGALRELGDVLTRMPEYALAHVTRGAALLIRYDFAGARSELDSAAQWDPELAFIPQMRAQLLASEGKSDEALVEARRALALAPQDAGALFILARIEHRLGHTDDLRKHAAQIVERTPVQAREARITQVRTAFGQDVLPAGLEDVLPQAMSKQTAEAAAGAAGGHASL